VGPRIAFVTVGDITGRRCDDLRTLEAFDSQDYGVTRELRSRPTPAVTGTTRIYHDHSGP
jgi:hypothetical protein